MAKDANYTIDNLYFRELIKPQRFIAATPQRGRRLKAKKFRKPLQRWRVGMSWKWLTGTPSKST